MGRDEHPFSQLSGSATAFFELPVPTHPVLAFRGGGRNVWGDAPFHELAYIGGRGTVRGIDAQRYAGDASIYGTSELRVPVAHLRYIIPLDIGLLGFADAGRVYVDGESSGGWHTVGGGGLWFGILDEATGFSVTFTSSGRKAYADRDGSAVLETVANPGDATVRTIGPAQRTNLRRNRRHGHRFW